MPEKVIVFCDQMYFDQLSDFATTHGWREETVGGEPVRMADPQDVDKWLFEWSTQDDDQVQYIYDEILECDIFRIIGDHANVVEAMVRAEFQVQDVNEAAEAYREDLPEDERKRLLLAIACMLPDGEDEQVASGIMRGLHDDWSSVRFAAVIAAKDSGWQRFEERLRMLSERDPDPNVRTLAAGWFDERRIDG